jgi:hypothetical protein
VELGELEAVVRRVVAEELRPVGNGLARLATTATAPSPPDVGSPVGYMRERWRQRWTGEFVTDWWVLSRESAHDVFWRPPEASG